MNLRPKLPPQLPVVFNQTPSDLRRLTEAAIVTSHATLNSLIANIPPSEATFANFVLPWIHDRNTRMKTSSLVALFRSVSPSEELRDASVDCMKIFSEFGQEITARPEIYKLFQAVKEKGERLDEEEQYYLDRKLCQLVRSGAALLDGPVKDRFRDVVARLDDIEAEGSKRIRQENGGIWFTAAELRGFPPDALATLKKGEGDREGKYKVTYGTVDLDLVYKNCVNPETRKRIFMGNEMKCADNLPLFREMVELRAEHAELLGYKSHADLTIQNRLMTHEGVKSFLDEMQDKTAVASKSNMEKLRKLKRQTLVSQGLEEGEIDDRLFLWDQLFYMRLLEEQEHDLDQNKIAEFFPLDETVQGLLENFEILFGVVFVDLSEKSRELMMEKQEHITWHEDVAVYAVWDEEALGGGFLGYLHLDLLKRKGKRDHACCITLQPGFETIDGGSQFPSALLVMSVQRPTDMKPTLLRHRSVVTMFHELGHGIHCLVGRTRFAETYGTKTSRDFVEIPSRMLENFCWDATILQKLSNHYSHLSPEYMASWKTDKRLEPKPSVKAPLELLQKLDASRRVTLAPLTQRQIAFSKFDMAIHSVSSEKAKTMDIGDLYNGIRQECTGLLGPEVGGVGYSRFSHMFGGYDAGYYTYVLASVYSSDLYQTRFAHDPMNREEGRKYRKSVLGRGGSGREMGFLEEYLGRKPNGDAFAKSIIA
ncbi:related to metallopeptidase MepB [Rhynchosporium secalis]|uniref:Related to metallopeptidase MepB n=1 Tax=Rhynchosporium secalis TaxID=38038 RepID=A0A1E1MTI1_RHYSE|nr:related to metallopeptidase MepB [Rhynchosporium secalis]